MISLLIVVTVLCLLVPFYVYAGYPLLLWIMTRAKPFPNHVRDDITPTVTLVISCYNEAGVIKTKLDNALALDYPGGRLHIVAVSDGSDDGTDDIVRTYSGQGVELIRQDGRLGKTMGLNLAMERISSDVVVFSDANALYEADAILQLVRNFADPAVGYVVGAALYTDGNDGASARNENLYWRYELAIKTMESQLHSVVGGDGAIYAIRRELWQSLDRRDINDFVNPLQIVAKGYRGIFEPEARCYEETAGEFGKEVARKERIVNRSIRGLMRVKAVMDPRRSGVFAWEVISHKLLRWLIPLFLVLGLIGSATLAAHGNALFWLVTFGALVLVVLAWRGHMTADKNQLPVWVATPYYFVMVNLYSVKGIVSAIRGETQVTWNSTRAIVDTESQTGVDGAEACSMQTWWFVTTAVLVVSLGWGYGT